MKFDTTIKLNIHFKSNIHCILQMKLTTYDKHEINESQQLN